MLLSMLSCKPTSIDEGEIPKFWCWMNYSADKNWDEIFTQMSSVGMNGLLLNAKAEDYPKVVPFAKKIWD